jgi:hypothetical protein
MSFDVSGASMEMKEYPKIPPVVNRSHILEVFKTKVIRAERLIKAASPEILKEQDGAGNTLLHEIFWGGCAYVVGVLFDFLGRNIDAIAVEDLHKKNSKGFTPFNLLCLKGDMSGAEIFFKRLIRKKAEDVAVPANNGISPFYGVASCGKADFMEVLCENYGACRHIVSLVDGHRV